MIPLKKQLEELELEDLTERKPNLIYLKSKQTMKYDITKPKAPKMPTLGKGTECIKILLSQASKMTKRAFFECSIPYVAHISTVLEFTIHPFLEAIECPNGVSGG